MELTLKVALCLLVFLCLYELSPGRYLEHQFTAPSVYRGEPVGVAALDWLGPVLLSLPCG